MFEELSNEGLVDSLIRTVSEVAPASQGLVIDPLAESLAADIKPLKEEILRRMNKPAAE